MGIKITKKAESPTKGIVKPGVHLKVGVDNEPGEDVVTPKGIVDAHTAGVSAASDLKGVMAKPLHGNTLHATADATLTKEFPDGSSTEEKIPYEHPAVLNETPVLIGVTVGVTRNLGNYESLRVSLSLTLPCKQDSQDIEDTYASAKGWVDDKINAINEEITESLA